MPRQLLWFKLDLRLDDHPAVQAALHAECLLPVFVFDPDPPRGGPFAAARPSPRRLVFLRQSLNALDQALRQRGSRLLVLQGRAEQIIPALVARLDLNGVVTLAEIAPDERAELTRVRATLGAVPLRELPGNDLLREDQLPLTVAELPTTFTPFRALVERQIPLFQPVSAPQWLPPLPAGIEALLAQVAALPDPEPVHAYSAFPFAGGETAARQRLEQYLWRDPGVRQYKDTRNGLIGSDYSSKFSPWLANGCLSPRRVMAELQRHETQLGQNDSTYWLWVELLWREFFRWTLVRHGGTLFRAGGLKEKATWTATDERFGQWCQGLTGVPLVDANMRELAATGFMSNRGRQVVASYLIHDLQQHWRYGASWFEAHLLDYDPASNWGNWAYLAGVGNDPRSDRVFNTLRQARQYDPDAAYISLWLPELKAVPLALRHTPFLLPAGQLQALGYPRLATFPEAWRAYLPTQA
ncbi:MAG: DASH family cryptochrome [Pseudomonadota bacterium]